MKSVKTAAILMVALAYSMSVQALNLSNLFGGGQPKPQTIKVLLVHDAEGAMLDVQGSYNIYDPANGARLGTRFSAKSYPVTGIPEGLKWGEEFPGVYQFKLVPDSEKTSLSVNGYEFRGNVYAYQINRRVSLVAEVDIEDYVASVIASNFDLHTPAEALAAAAIAIRTDAYYQLNHSSSRFFHVDARETGYVGYGVTLRHPSAERAVNLTRFMVMLNTDGSGATGTFAAKCTENCAGKTAPFHMMYRQDGNAPSRGVTSPFAENDRAEARWNSSITKMELAQVAHIDRISKINLLRDSDSGKVFGIRFEDGYYNKEVDFPTLQRQLGKDVLRSSDFQVRVDGDVVLFEGYGEGDGVGLCLYSANRMAERGADARKILNAFFPTAYLEVLTPGTDRADRLIAEESRRARFGA